jgi:hypothetical protein
VLSIPNLINVVTKDLEGSNVTFRVSCLTTKTNKTYTISNKCTKPATNVIITVIIRNKSEKTTENLLFQMARLDGA